MTGKYKNEFKQTKSFKLLYCCYY